MTEIKGATLQLGDFESIIDTAREGDFVFVDPPYTVKHNLNGFLKYNEKLFSWDDQIRLRDSVVRAASRGATILISNANHASIRRLYKGIGTKRILTRQSVLANDATKRGAYEELVIKINFVSSAKRGSNTGRQL